MDWLTDSWQWRRNDGQWMYDGLRVLRWTPNRAVHLSSIDTANGYITRQGSVQCLLPQLSIVEVNVEVGRLHPLKRQQTGPFLSTRCQQ
eukprot:scaffold12666_cov25-Cyclotella_meneghiniana.AAC.1